MRKFVNLLLVAICLHQQLYVSDAGEPVCASGKKQRMSLVINSARDDKDEWLTKFSASRNVSEKPKNIQVELIRSAMDCDDSYYINVEGIIKEDAGEEKREGKSEGKPKGLYFHNKCSPNAAITNDGKTLQKLKVDGGGAAQTNRPLKDNEIFTVRIDKMETKFGHAIGIGVTTFAPDAYAIPDHLNTLQSNAWTFYHNHLYHKTQTQFPNFISKNLKDMKVGQRIGVMRSKTAALHLFLDGVDQGPAVSNIPENVYGTLEMFGNLLQATIVDP